MQEKKIVVHMKGGNIRKGVTHDFTPQSESFHLLPAEGGGVPYRVKMDDMKALFYVKDYLGNRDFNARKEFEGVKHTSRKAIVLFNDGEEIWGYQAEDQPDDQLGFFFYPADEKDNNLQIFIIRSATKEIREVSS